MTAHTKFRPATDAEVTEHVAKMRSYNGRLRFRHFVRECIDRRTWNGVRHVQFTTAKVDAETRKVVSGQYKGETLIATVASNPEFTRDMVFDVRLDGLK